MPNTLSSPLVRYGGAFLVVILATWCRIGLEPVLGEGTPFLTYFPAIVFIAWACGSAPALLSVLAAAALAAYFFQVPRFAPRGTGRATWLLWASSSSSASSPRR